ncbi:MAG: hypothetical protein Q8922_09495 [Bacteroidota bacterium]|nr:hypothetical protein [Bacteroidota bacterium]MDP4234426.1 hypothetical protein [Bacteroidota bacterium]MDP4243992.1 hypothetical protein [Bacteroidota bacterium]MDP4288158.1 hypothetical protein [Bacteroidota bacterium]
MAQIEEQILAYLDGSLDPSEREEVLRAITDSPEGRRALDAHVRMGDLLTHAAKPVSAPLETQRALASKLPLLSVMLPYLAAPVQDRRVATSWFGARSTQLAIAAAVLGIVGAGVWFALNNSHPSSSLQRSDNLIQSSHSTSNSSAPYVDQLASNGSREGEAHEGAATTHGSTAPSAALHASSNRSARHLAKIASTTPDGTTRLRAGATELPAGSAHLPAVAIRVPAGNGSDAVTPSTPVGSSAQNAQSSDAIPPIALASAEPRLPPTDRQSHNSNLPHFMLERGASSYVPLRMFINANQHNTWLPDAPLTKRTMDSQMGVTSGSEMSSGFEGGLEYEISPWLSAGARVGYSRFYQIQTYSYYALSPYSEDLVQRYSDAYVGSVNAYWAGVAMRYEFNPQDRLRFGASGVLGLAFIPGSLSGLGMFEFSGNYSLFNFLALEAAVSVDASQVSPKQSATTGVASNASGPLGVVTVGPNRDKLTSFGVGARFGLAFHP